MAEKLNAGFAALLAEFAVNERTLSRAEVRALGFRPRKGWSIVERSHQKDGSVEYVEVNVVDCFDPDAA